MTLTEEPKSAIVQRVHAYNLTSFTLFQLIVKLPRFFPDTNSIDFSPLRKRQLRELQDTLHLLR